MSNSEYFLEGGIMNKESVFLYFSHMMNGEITPYLLIRVDTLGKQSYMLSSTAINNKGVANTSYIPTFVISTSSYSHNGTEPVVYELKDTISSNLGIDSSNMLTNDSWGDVVNKTCSSYQSLYQPWNEPVSFLAGVGYTFNIGSGPVYIKDINDNLIDLTECVLYMVPVKWYQQGMCSRRADSSLGLTYTYCYIANDKENLCSDIPNAWTSQKDCDVSLEYSYCNMGVTCQSQCKGPCVKKTDKCNWNTGIESFQCDFDSSNLFVGQWWESKWFIITIYIISLSSLIFLILIFVLRSRNKDPEDNTIVNDKKTGAYLVTQFE